MLNEFYRVAFRKKVYRSTDELQADLDAWIKEYNEARPHQGRWCFGKIPMRTFPGNADDEGENDRGLTATGHLNLTAQPGVPANTLSWSLS